MLLKTKELHLATQLRAISLPCCPPFGTWQVQSLAAIRALWPEGLACQRIPLGPAVSARRPGMEAESGVAVNLYGS